MYSQKLLKQKLKEISGIDVITYFLCLKFYIPFIANLLNEEDEILACRIPAKLNNDNGILIVLKDKLLFINTSGLVSSNEIYLNNIASYSKNYKGLYSVIITDKGGTIYNFGNLDSKNADIIVDYLNKMSVNDIRFG